MNDKAQKPVLNSHDLQTTPSSEEAKDLRKFDEAEMKLAALPIIQELLHKMDSVAQIVEPAPSPISVKEKFYNSISSSDAVKRKSIRRIQVQREQSL